MKFPALLAWFSISLISFCLIIICSATADSQHSDINEVLAIGHGATLLEARSDVIRQALQQTMQQLLVVDRVIQDDQIVRDKIMSTMNGYIDKFQEIRSFEENGQIAVEAKITVSSSRITNFIGSVQGQAAKMAGSSILAESQRMMSQRKVLGEIFDHLFIGFPSDVIELTITGINIDEQSPDTLNVSVRINYSNLWLEQLYTGVKALSIDHASSGACPDRCTKEWNINTAQYNLAKSRENKVKREGEDAPTDVGNTEFCMEYGGHGECFMLPTGDYAKTLILSDQPPPVNLAIRFIDINSSSTFIDKSKCKFADALYPEKNPDPYKGDRIRAGINSWKGSVMYSYWVYKDHTRLTLPPLNIQAMFKYKGSEIDLARTTKLGAVATYCGRRFKSGNLDLDRCYPELITPSNIGVMISDIAGDINSQPDVCGNKLDDAIRWMP